MKAKIFAAVMLLYGIMYLALGVVLLVKLYRAPDKGHPPARHLKTAGASSRDYPFSRFVAIWAPSVGLLMIVLALVPQLHPALMPTVLWGYSLLLFGAGFYLGILLPSRCTQQVSGVFSGATTTFTAFASPEFHLEWKGEVFVVHTMEITSAARLYRSYSINFPYDFFINPLNPYEAIMKRRFSGTAALAVFVGIVFLFFGILCLS